ncbi:MAG: D-alanyl-D-alanine carboxypeptidase, partial [Burkholderiales bacterium]|nr:D-alanyl-D-alanine carboxypeptidase [Burkholderiales bacterium]
ATVPLAAGPCGDWRTGLQARFEQPTAIRLGGKYPAACGPRDWPVAYVDPDSYAERALEGMWRSGGGLLTGRVRTGPASAAAKLVHDAPSLPLADIVADINKFSNNVMAQQLFLTLGRLSVEAAVTANTNTHAPSGVATFERSRAWVGRWWQARFGAAVPLPYLDNGSGLSRDERITADALLALLRDAAAHPTAGPVLMQSLPVAGVDGTATRMGERGIMKTALGNARIKTGSLRDVAAVAGYVQTLGGTPWAVVGIINHANAAQARPALDALLEWVASQPR